MVFHFTTNTNRQLPLVLGGLPVLPEHWFKGRDFTRPLQDAPIGSGPYRITHFELGRSITFERDPNWWAAKLPTGIGTNNFDRVQIEYFRDFDRGDGGVQGRLDRRASRRTSRRTGPPPTTFPRCKAAW